MVPGPERSFSQSRHENFSRTVWITFQERGITSRVSVTSSPSFERRSPPQAGQEQGAGTTTRSRGRCSGNGFLCGPLALEGRDRGGLCCRFLGDQIILGCVSLELFELQLHLIEQAAAAFGTGAILLALQLCDLQL